MDYRGDAHPPPDPRPRRAQRIVTRGLLPATVAGIFLAALAAIVALFARWAGSAAALAPMLRHPPAIAMGLASLGCVVLSAWIAAALRAGGARRRRALLAGWLAAAPGLLVLAAATAEASGNAAALRFRGALDPVLAPLVSAALRLPFSAGLVLFAPGFVLAVSARGALGLLRRYRSQA
jgi:hypothetical protein